MIAIARAALALLFLAAACHPTTVRDAGAPPAPDVTARSSTNQALVRGRVTLASDLRAVQPVRGNLAIYWMTRDEAEAQKNGSLSLRSSIDLLGRFVTVKSVDLSAPGAVVDYALRAPAGDLVVMAILDRGHEFFSTFLEGGGDGNMRGSSALPQRVAASATTNIDIVLSEVIHVSEKPEPCAGERFRLETMSALKLAGVVKDPTARRLCVHLPPSYDAEPKRRYPVLYAFAGLMGSDTSGSIRATMKAADEASADREAIVVGVDLRSRFG